MTRPETETGASKTNTLALPRRQPLSRQRAISEGGKKRRGKQFTRGKNNNLGMSKMSVGTENFREVETDKCFLCGKTAPVNADGVCRDCFNRVNGVGEESGEAPKQQYGDRPRQDGAWPQQQYAPNPQFEQQRGAQEYVAPSQFGQQQYGGSSMQPTENFGAPQGGHRGPESASYPGGFSAHKNGSGRIAAGVISIVFGVLTAILFWAASRLISDAGNRMSGIRSVAGGTITEVYYNFMGQAFSGLGLFSCALGFAVLGAGVGLGVYLISRAKK